MGLYDNALYIEDIDYVAGLDLPWNIIKGKQFLISGATGLVGSFLIDVLMRKNESGLGCHVYALSRNEARFFDRFSRWISVPELHFISHDINNQLNISDIEKVEYVLHMASNTHPMQYSSDPIGTITTNIVGLRNMLEFAVKKHAERFIFASSNEVYGENRGDVELFNEDYCGYINSNTMRAGYPESKRCGEALCQAYRAQKGLNVVIPRLTRSYGPTMLMSDTKAISQFIRKGIKREDIVLKSSGTQYYSYTYVADAVSGLFTILLKGENGEAYNIADEKSDITLKDLSLTIANVVGRKVVFANPDIVESAGYSTATKARLDGGKLKQIGWRAKYNIDTGIKRTIVILSELENQRKCHGLSH